MAAITLNTTRKAAPMIYAYTTPDVPKHNGWVKIGYSEVDVSKRVSRQGRTIDVETKEEWRGNAVFEDGSYETFTDRDFHAYLRKNGVEQKPGYEWFHISAHDSERMFIDFKHNRGILKSIGVRSYTLRKEQQEAVAKARDYFYLHKDGEFLWNAKPRFGKTLSVYELCKQLGAEIVLILTNRPVIATSWLKDYNKFLGEESGYLFVSEVDALKGKPGVFTRKEFASFVDDDYRLIEFVSLQDLKGSKYFSTHSQIDKLGEVAQLTWDLLVLDEAHEGVDTFKSEIALDNIHRKNTLHLSGTPFKALANAKFETDAIFNWTYMDEQRAKKECDDNKEEQENPYRDYPRLNMFTYQMSEIIHDEVSQGIQIEGKSVEYAFDLNEFFAVNENGRFLHNDSVDRFLDALTTQEKFPFSTDELRNELKHTLWLLDRVESAKALVRKLRLHPIFKDYKIIPAVGDGKIDNNETVENPFDEVNNAIKKYDKTITLSVRKLTTGVTIPEWSGVLMLSNIKSPALYMQAAFRAQNPCLYRNGAEFLRKQNAYIFDFDPARTLIIFEEFANGLIPEDENSGNVDIRRQRVRQLLNFFPVIGEDENGEMIPLDAEKVLSIPRKIKSQEVVRRGFMCDYLFQNISNIFRAPQAVMEILNNITPAKKPEPLPANLGQGFTLDENGEVTVPQQKVIGTATELFGEKHYADIGPVVIEPVTELPPKPQPDELKKAAEEMKKNFHETVTTPLVETAGEKYGNDMRDSTKRELERKINNSVDNVIDRAVATHQIEQNKLEAEINKLIEDAETDNEAEKLKKELEAKSAELMQKFREETAQKIADAAQEAGNKIVETVETEKAKAVKRSQEDEIRDHLRGFSRTIPSFLMAYGKGDNITLMTFDTVVPANVFKEVTSISLEQFLFLRDGGDYTNTETGETEHFNGKLFDQDVFDASVKVFMDKKEALADYFDEGNKEDIFDYIPPQKTNQIFTPKVIVKKMVDMLEQENPGCFDDPEKTFIDLYMKSGLFITEIVKRLYNSPKMKSIYPDSKARLHHIFEKQVYGLAPTEIIYKIAESYILGFDEKSHTIKHNLRQADALPYAKKGELDKLLDKLYK